MLYSLSSRRVFLTTLLASIPFSAIAQFSLPDAGRMLDQIPKSGGGGSSTGKGAGLGEGEIGSGLKDALKVASQRVVGRVGKADGFNADPSIRIPLPGALQSIQGPLKSVGAGGMLDDLQLKMNRAAEQAAPKALTIFTDAASKMTIDDARGILNGPQDSATQYFKRTTSGSLTTAFRPIVDSSLSSVGAVGALKSVQTQASSLPMVGQSAQGLDLTDFTVGKALDGLFHYLGVEEGAIRSNPAARSTELLKKVFS
jgi:hypothetical protein